MANGKILYCASTMSHLQNFHQPYIQKLRNMGYQVVLCAEKETDQLPADGTKIVPFQKHMTSMKNLKNILQIRKILKKEKFLAVSVHTTLAAAIVRAAILLLPRAKRPKVFCTCHGYLFHAGDSLGKWKYLLPEKLCTSVTDVLMVMNREDYQIAEKHRLYREKLFLIPGMGVEFRRFDLPQSKAELRQQYGIAAEEVLFVFAGEFSERKNQQLLVSAFARVAGQMPKAKLVLAGEGALQDACRQQAVQLGIAEQIQFPGHVENMPVLYHCCDVCISASKIEGLPFNIMEAMYCELPCIASRVKGHEDLLHHRQTGYLYETETELAAYMVQLYQDRALRKQLGQNARQAVMAYRLDAVQPVIMQVYEENG